MENTTVIAVASIVTAGLYHQSGVSGSSFRRRGDRSRQRHSRRWRNNRTHRLRSPGPCLWVWQ